MAAQSKPGPAKHYDGWTPGAVAGLRRLLREYPPIHEFGLRTAKVNYRNRKSCTPGKIVRETSFDAGKESARIKQGRNLQEKLEETAEYIRGAFRRAKLPGFWCVFVEWGRDSGWHLHAWTDTEFPAELDAKFKRWWNRRSGANCDLEENYCYHAAPVEDQNKTIEYFGKVYRCRKGEKPYRAKGAFSEYCMGAEGHFLPYRSGGNRSERNAEKRTVNQEKTHPEAGSESGFTLATHDAHKPDPSLLDNGSSALRLHPEFNDASYFIRDAAAVQPILVGVRIFPLFGPAGEDIPPDQTWTENHFRTLSAKWVLIRESIRHPGPPFDADCVEADFLIPPGQTIEFEREAGIRWARIVRR